MTYLNSSGIQSVSALIKTFKSHILKKLANMNIVEMKSVISIPDKEHQIIYMMFEYIL